MKNKKKLIKRISALLCAVVVFFSSFGLCTPFLASTSTMLDNYGTYGNITNAECKYNYRIDASFNDVRGASASQERYFNIASDSECVFVFNERRVDDYVYKNYNYGTVYYYTMFCFSRSPIYCLIGGYVFNYTRAYELSDGSVVYCGSYYQGNPCGEGGFIFSSDMTFGGFSHFDTSLETNFVNVYNSLDIDIDSPTKPLYNSSLGYLQNVSRKSTYIRGALYNYDEDSLTYHWYHDLTSSSGIDLTSGDYKIRHYISKATVKGYEKEDIIEMSDKYLVGEYDASQGYFSYLDKDYEESIRVQGYEDIGWVDKYLRGYFVLEHSYFQIVNTATNEVGGYLHFYPKDASGDSFGVELEYEGLDNENNVVEDAPSGYIDTQTGSGTTVEDALENADEPKFDDLSGVDEFIGVVDAYAVQVGNVSSGFGALLSSFPPWVVGVLGLAFVFLVIGVIIKVMV